MLSLPEPGTPFHRLARTPAHRWWRPVLGTLAVALLGITGFLAVYLAGEAAGIIFNRPAGPDGAHSFGATTDTWLFTLSFGLLAPAALLVAHYVQRRPAGTLGSVQLRTRRRWLGTCLLVAAAAAALLVAASELAYAVFDGGDDGPTAGAGEFARTVLAFVVPTLLASVALEYLFRGWLLQAVGAFGGGPWPAIAVQALLFAALLGTPGPWSFAQYAVTGVALGWLAVRTGGLEAGIALTIVIDLVTLGYAVLFGDLTGDGPSEDTVWQFVVLDAVVVAAYAAVVARLARRREVATVTPSPAAVLEPA
jgi:membrane protease YdiL (CAAX protease family)